MMNGNVQAIVRLKTGKLRVHVSIDVDGIEEIASREYNTEAELPKGIRRGVECKVIGVGDHGGGEDSFYFTDLIIQGDSL